MNAWPRVTAERAAASTVFRSAPPAAFYRYSRDRKAEQAEALLGTCRGFLHADGYAGFKGLYEGDPKIAAPRLIEVACWSHARRKIYDVHVDTARSRRS